MENHQYISQFKTVGELQETIETLIREHRTAKGKKLGILFRVLIPPNPATTYIEGSQGPYRLIHGVRVGDYTFDQTLEWVLPDPAAGLSFSKSFSHLKSTWKLLKKHAGTKDKSAPANIASWILENRSLPKGMAFTQDPKNTNHYFLSVTEKMHVSTLVTNLTIIAHAMTIMKDLT